MAPTTPELLASPIFEVLASQELKPFLAHAGILSKSDTLKALIEGGWKDSVDRKIRLEEWDVDTVGRWLEWLYSGDYSSPYPEPPSSSMKPGSTGTKRAATFQTIQASARPASDFGLADQFAKVDIRRDNSVNTSNRIMTSTPLSGLFFDRIDYQHRKSSIESFDLWMKTCGWQPWELNFEAALFAHAKIYCLANYMLLPDLQALAFQHLKTILMFIDPLHSRSPAISNIVALVRYVYAHTTRPQNGGEPLQRLLTTFIVINASGFRDDGGGEISQLMNEGGDFAVDLWCKASLHLGHWSNNSESLKSAMKNVVHWKT